MSSPALTRDRVSSSAIMKYSRWDWIPAGLAVLHLFYVTGIFIAFPFMSWPVFIAAALLYSHFNILEYQQHFAQFHS